MLFAAITWTFYCFFYRNHSTFIVCFLFPVDTFEEFVFLSKCPFSLWSVLPHRTACRKMGVLLDSLWKIIAISLQNHAVARWLWRHLRHPWFCPNCCKQKHHFLPFKPCSSPSETAASLGSAETGLFLPCFLRFSDAVSTWTQFCWVVFFLSFYKYFWISFQRWSKILSLLYIFLDVLEWFAEWEGEVPS